MHYFYTIGDIMENPEIKLELTLNEINMILASLGKHPFDEISQLIGKSQLLTKNKQKKNVTH